MNRTDLGRKARGSFVRAFMFSCQELLVPGSVCNCPALLCVSGFLIIFSDTKMLSATDKMEPFVTCSSLINALIKVS